MLDLGKYTTIFVAYGVGMALAVGAFAGERLAHMLTNYWSRRSFREFKSGLKSSRH